jgi:hypothetical protein
VTGEVPSDILDAILADAAGRSGAAAADIAVLRGEAVLWNDGSLGCPQPGEFYTQALVSGYWVVLEAGGRQFDYRVTERGGFFLCENPRPPVSTPGGSDR